MEDEMMIYDGDQEAATKQRSVLVSEITKRLVELVGCSASTST